MKLPTCNQAGSMGCKMGLTTPRCENCGPPPPNTHTPCSRTLQPCYIGPHGPAQTETYFPHHPTSIPTPSPNGYMTGCSRLYSSTISASPNQRAMGKSKNLKRSFTRLFQNLNSTPTPLHIMPRSTVSNAASCHTPHKQAQGVVGEI